MVRTLTSVCALNDIRCGARRRSLGGYRVCTISTLAATLRFGAFSSIVRLRERLFAAGDMSLA